MKIKKEILKDLEHTPEKSHKKGIEVISDLVNRLKEKEQELNDAEELFKKVKAEYRNLSENIIPDKFTELGLAEITLKTGEKVSIKQDYFANISQDNWLAAISWLQINGSTAIIKNSLQVMLPFDETEIATNIKNQLNDLGVTYKSGFNIHPSTLKAFVRLKKEEGSDIPDKVFGIHPHNKTVISKRRKH